MTEPPALHTRVVGLTGQSLTGQPVASELSVHTFTGTKPGLTLLMTAGLHGDEYEGPLALADLIRSLDPAQLRGRLILLPVANPPALAARQRCSPHDMQDLNRCFPGRHDGTLTERIAAFIAEELAPAADVVIDLHAGGEIEMILPCAMIHPVGTDAQFSRSLALATAFAAPAAMVVDESRKPGMFDSHVEDQGKPFLCAELGGGGMLTPATCAIAARGVRNSLIHLGMIEGEPEPGAWDGWNGCKLLVNGPADCIEVDADGFYEPLIEVGTPVVAGQPVGLLHQLDRPAMVPDKVRAPVAGWLFIQAAGGPVPAGLTLCAVARDAGDELTARSLLGC